MGVKLQYNVKAAHTHTAQCAASDETMAPCSRGPLSSLLVDCVNDALWDEIRCWQTGAAEKRSQQPGRLRLGQWEAAACSRGAESCGKQHTTCLPAYMLIVEIF